MPTGPSVYCLRAAAAGDLPGILHIARAVKEAPQWSVATYGAMVQPPAHSVVQRVFFVAEGDRGIVGFAAANALLERCELESIVVEANHRRRGVARLLNAALVCWAVEQSAEVFALEVRSSNKSAQAFYKKCGFMETGCRLAYYSDPVDDAILMQLILGSGLRV